MKITYWKGATIVAVLTLLLVEPVLAQSTGGQLSSGGIMNDVLRRFNEAASTWGTIIEAAASRLFWALTTISMVWTFGMMVVRKADIGEFFAELSRFIIVTGFFWWLLTNAVTGMNIAGTIITSMQKLGAEAGGLSTSNLGPSSIVDLGFDLYNRTIQATSELSWREMGTAIVMELQALAVLLVLALVSINMLLTLASAWIVLYSGIIVLGFGGSRWTTDIAINYYKTILGIALQLLAMVLIVSIGKSFLTHYFAQLSNTLATQELAVMLVVAIILLVLVNKVPPLIAGIITGASAGGGGIGSFGAGTLFGAGMTAAGLATQAGAAIASGGASLAASAAGGAAAVAAAASKANDNVSAGTDILSTMMGGGGGGGGSAGTSSTSGDAGGGSGGVSGSGETPLAAAAGHNSTGARGGNSGGGLGGGRSSGGIGATAAKGGRIAADTVANLAKGIGSMASTKAGSMADAAKSRIAETTGGKLAATIKATHGNKSAGTFDGNNLAGTNDSTAAGANDEVAAFVNRPQPT
ncbi:conjugal transfer protein TrbL [Brucella anthropi]|uniref:P-type conjugative transfer protein TrbL n=1 Tax=Brucella anthropi TaxID=529 RepID=UPI003986F1C4